MLAVPRLTGARCVLRALVVSDAPSLQRHADDVAGCVGVRPDDAWLRCNAELRRSAIKNGQVIDRVQWACLRPD